jgi:acetolactate synthase-1/2/3 large subunit
VAHTTPGPCPGPVDLPAIYRWLRTRLPEDTGITVGAGAYALWAQRYFPHRQVRTLIGPKSGAMGYGLPAAIGAAIACPARRFVALAGDGCFTMNAEELATAVQERVRVVTLVFNNAAYGAIRMTQQRVFGRAVGTALAALDFAAFARSFGAHGERVTSTAEFAPAFERAFAVPGPAVIDIVIPPEATRPG